jgi:hypothetical protein
MKADPRYTSNAMFDSYPWPQSPNAKQIMEVAEATESLRTEQRTMMENLVNLSGDPYRTSARKTRESVLMHV